MWEEQKDIDQEIVELIDRIGVEHGVVEEIEEDDPFAEDVDLFAEDVEPVAVPLPVADPPIPVQLDADGIPISLPLTYGNLCTFLSRVQDRNTKVRVFDYKTGAYYHLYMTSHAQREIDASEEFYVLMAELIEGN
jgi:hypothetical protein